MPKGRQNGPKIDQKKRCKFKSDKVTSWSRLGAILGRFPTRLGVKHIDFSLFFKGFVNIHVFEKMSVQERSETKNGAKMAPTWHQNGSQNGLKIDPKI